MAEAESGGDGRGDLSVAHWGSKPWNWRGAVTTPFVAWSSWRTGSILRSL